MERIRNANFMIYQGLLSSFGVECVVQYNYCFECTSEENEEAGCSRWNEDLKKKKKRLKGLHKGGWSIKRNGLCCLDLLSVDQQVPRGKSEISLAWSLGFLSIQAFV